MKSFIPLIVLLFLSFHSFGQQINLSESIERGNLVYSSNCSACHMVNGEGLNGVFPPVVQTEILKDTPALVKAIVNGVSGKTVVKGVEYNGAMSGYPLSDEQVADLINYMRNSWGNSGEPVTPADIQPALKK